ncbi:MAG: hypothetical protein V4736_03215 [Bdellovibrionota bacterium]
MKFFNALVALAVGIIFSTAHAQYVVGGGANYGANYGTGLTMGQQGCGQAVQRNKTILQGNDQMKDLKKQYKEAAAELKIKDRARQRAELDFKKSEGKLRLIFNVSAIGTIKSHVQNARKDGVTCASYNLDTEATQVQGEEGGEKVEKEKGEYEFDPFTETQWKAACPVGKNGKNAVLSSVELCKMSEHKRSGSSASSDCNTAVTNYQRQVEAVDRLNIEVATLKDQMEYINDAYDLEMESYVADIQSGEVRLGGNLGIETEAGFCVDCERSKKGRGIGAWLGDNMGSLLQIGLGVGYGFAAHETAMDIADYNANIGHPTEGTNAVGILAGSGLVANGVLGLLSGGQGQLGGAQGSMRCAGNPGWVNGNQYTNGNANGNANQWAFGNPYLDGNVQGQGGPYNQGFNPFNTNTAYNVNPALAINGYGAAANPFATNSPFNIGNGGNVQIGANGVMSPYVGGGGSCMCIQAAGCPCGAGAIGGAYAQGGVGAAGPQIFGYNSNGSMPNAGIGAGGYLGPWAGVNGGAYGAGQFGGGNPIQGLIAQLMGGGNGGAGVQGNFGGNVGGGGGQMVCNQTGCFNVGGGGGAQYNPWGQAQAQFANPYAQAMQYDPAAAQYQLQQQQAQLQFQQQQAAAAYQQQMVNLQNQMVAQQQAANARMELMSAYQKYQAALASGGSYLYGNSGAGGGAGAGAYISVGAGVQGNFGGNQGAFIGGPNPGFAGGAQFGGAGQFGGGSQFGGSPFGGPGGAQGGGPGVPVNGGVNGGSPFVDGGVGTPGGGAAGGRPGR